MLSFLLCRLGSFMMSLLRSVRMPLGALANSHAGDELDLATIAH